MGDQEAEVPLRGGLVDKVVRVGNTVRRPVGPWTATTQALLAHLRRAGFPCPEPLGYDDQGREVLSYLPGDPMLGPMPALLSAEACSRLGRFIRALHDAASSFVPPEPVWQAGARSLLPGETILHGDLGPTNLLFSGSQVVGLVDWDMAYPGWGVTDLADLARSLVPLQPPPTDPAKPNLSLERRHERLVALGEGYGLGDLVQLLTEFVRSCKDGSRRMTIMGDAGVEPWSTFRDHGLVQGLERQAAWVEENFEALLGTD